MSKRRRDRGESSDDLLGDLSQNYTPSSESASLSSMANAAYGSQIGDESFIDMGKGRIKVQLLPIDVVYPDFAQPRRAIPSTIRKYWQASPSYESMSYIFEMWLKEITIEKQGKQFDLQAYLEGKETERAPVQWNEEQALSEKLNVGHLESAFLKIVSLASSIKRDGLTNPITIIQRGTYYAIETGERRWLAYHLLNWFYSNSEWQKIPARIMNNLSIWRQATENNARADLNAIAKARQLALIIMDLYTSEFGTQFRPFEIYKNEQAFYAQVADPIRYKIPYGKGELVLNAMGFENKSTIKRYRDLLALPPEVWTRSDDNNVPESVLRQLVDKPIEQQMGLFNTWLDTGRLYPENQQSTNEYKSHNRLGKLGKLMEYEIQQLQGEYDDMDYNSKEMVLKFLKDLIKSLENS
jgi:hypothetical protein